MRFAPKRHTVIYISVYWDPVLAPNSTATESDVNISWCWEIGLLCADALETKLCVGEKKTEICGADWCFNYSNWNDNNIPLPEWCKLIGWEKSRGSRRCVGFSLLSAFSLSSREFQILFINSLQNASYFSVCLSKCAEGTDEIHTVRIECCRFHISFAFDQCLPM